MQARFRKLLLFLICCGLTVSAFSQGGSISGQVFTTQGKPAPFAPVRVCPNTGTGTPCTPLSSLFSDPAMGHALTNPTQTDQFGNYSIFVTPGVYLVQITAAPNVLYSYLVTANSGGGGGATLPTNAPVYGLSPTTSRAAVANDIVGLWAGCTTGTVLGYSGLCVPNGGGTAPVGNFAVQSSNADATALIQSGFYVTDATGHNRYTNDSQVGINTDGGHTANVFTMGFNGDIVPAITPGQGFIATNLNFLSNCDHPGADNATSTGANRFTQCNGVNVTNGNSGGGLSGGLGIQLYCTSNSDCHGIDISSVAYGGGANGSDEHHENMRRTAQQAQFVYQGTIDLVTDSQHFHTLCLYDCPNAGDYRYIRRINPDVGAGLNVTSFTQLPDGGPSLVNIAPSQAAGTVASLVTVTPGSSQTPGTYIVNATGGGGTGAQATIIVSSDGRVDGGNANITNIGSGYSSAPTFILSAGGTPATFISTLEGLDTSYVATAQCALASGIDADFTVVDPLYTTVPFHATCSSGTLTNGSYIQFMDTMHDNGILQNVIDNGGGDFTGTISVRYSHKATGQFYQSKGYLALDLTLNRTGAFEELVHHPIECVMLSSSQLACGQFFSGGMIWMQLGFATADHFTLQPFQTVSRTSNVVTLNNFASPIFRGAPAISLSGMTPSSLNGPCLNPVTLTNATTCTQTGSDTTATVLGYVTLGTSGFGTAVGDISSIAQVVDVRNPLTQKKEFNTTFRIEQSNFAPTIGDVIIEDQVYANSTVGDHMALIGGNNPFIRNGGAMDWGFQQMSSMQGPGSGAVGNHIGVWRMQPFTDQLVGFGKGGSSYPMEGITISGPIQNIIVSDPPWPSGSGAYQFNCPVSPTGGNDCDLDHNYLYYLFGMRQGSGGLSGFGGGIYYKPYDGTLVYDNLRVQLEGNGRTTIGGYNICLENGTLCDTYLTTSGLKKWNAVTSNQWLPTTYADYVALWSPCNSSNPYMRYDGTCDNGPGSAVTQLVAGTGVVLSPSGGTGVVTISASGTGGSVTNVSGVNTNGFSFSIANPTTTPAITLNVDGSHYLPTTADQTNWNSKQAAGNYITSITGDGTASGPGAAALTVTRLNGVSLAGLTTGILKNTTSTGVPSIAAFSDINGLILAQTGCGTTGNFFQPNTGTCVAPTATGTVTHTGALTANKFMLGNSTADSKVDPNAGTDGAGNATFVSVAWNDGTSIGGGQDWTEGSAPSTASGHDLIYGLASNHRIQMLLNGGGALNIPGVATAVTSGHRATFDTNGIDLIDGGAPNSTATNCADSSTTPACGSAAAGRVVIAAGTTSVVVADSAVTADSEILITPDDSLGPALGVTCNTTLAVALAGYGVIGRTAGVGFTLGTLGTVTVNPACYSFTVTN